jgi:hypothetical protein
MLAIQREKAVGENLVVRKRMARRFFFQLSIKKIAPEISIN